MAVTHSQKQVLSFFLKGGATSALFRWLDFRLFVAQKKLQLDIHHAPSLSALAYLEKWQAQAGLTAPARSFLFVLNGLMAFTGFATMAGVLNMNGAHAVNIWIPLALFSFLPLIMTLSSAYFSLVSSNKRQLSGHPWLTFLVSKLHLAPYTAHKTLLMPWLFWQTQFLALVFSASALLAFFVLATFQDYHFGWSSTLISDNALMVHMMAVISWPWHAWVASPSPELVEQSRIVAQGLSTASAAHSRWWITLVMAMLVYGMLPRLVLTLVLRQRFVRQLKAGIINNADVEQFVVAQHHQVSRSPIVSDEIYVPLDEVIIDSSHVDIITWQQTQCRYNTIKNLGSDDWLEDEAWLNSAECQRIKPVCVIIDPVQTPTGELADCIHALQKKNNSVMLLLLADAEANKRFDTHVKSWQFFAQRHQISIQQGVLK